MKLIVTVMEIQPGEWVLRRLVYKQGIEATCGQAPHPTSLLVEFWTLPKSQLLNKIPGKNPAVSCS